MPNRRFAVLALLAAAVVSACTGGSGEPATAPTVVDAEGMVRPGAPGEPNYTYGPGETLDAPDPLDYSFADLQFMQQMIPHHAQALQMTALVEERSDNSDLRLFVERMDLSQEAEVEQITAWLEARGEEVPVVLPRDGGSAHAHGDVELMPGMLSTPEMERLASASGEEFDLLFLDGMTRHHLGALQMVETLFAAQDGGTSHEVLQLANDIDADQRIEINRMAIMRAALDAGG